MLIVANKESRNILFRVDAWDSECVEKAKEFIHSEHLKIVNDEVTCGGDWIIWVI